MTPDLFENLAKVQLSAGEWRVLTYIIAKTMLNEKESAVITLEELTRSTMLKNEHACRIRTSLVKRGFIRVSRFKKLRAYSVVNDPTKWKTKNSFKGQIPDKYWSDFRIWFNRYPNKVRREEARAIFYQLLDDGVPIGDLENALTGYLIQIWGIAMELGYVPLDTTLTLPTTFLKGKYKEFLK